MVIALVAANFSYLAKKMRTTTAKEVERLREGGEKCATTVGIFINAGMVF